MPQSNDPWTNNLTTTDIPEPVTDTNRLGKKFISKFNSKKHQHVFEFVLKHFQQRLDSLLKISD